MGRLEVAAVVTDGATAVVGRHRGTVGPVLIPVVVVQIKGQDLSGGTHEFAQAPVGLPVLVPALGRGFRNVQGFAGFENGVSKLFLDLGGEFRDRRQLVFEVARFCVLGKVRDDIHPYRGLAVPTAHDRLESWRAAAGF